MKKMSYGFSSSGVRSCISQIRWLYIEDRQKGSTHATRAKGEHQLAVDHWQTEESMHAARAKEDFQLAVDQSQTERNIADYQRIKMDNVEVIDQEENDSFEKKHSMLKEIAVFGLIVLIVAATVLIFGKVYVEYFLLS